MQIWLLAILFLLNSCTHDPTEGRDMASFFGDIHYGDIDFKSVQIRQFPPEVENGKTRLYFFIQLKDDQGYFIDRELSEFGVLNHKKEKENFQVKRVMRGRYYIIIERQSEFQKAHYTFWLKDKQITSKTVMMKVADRAHSQLKFLEKTDNRIKFLLTLNDRRNQPVELIYSPDIILEGNPNLMVEEVKLISKGKWMVTISYPGENFIMYLSVRSLGFSFKDLFRFQHVEK